MKCPRMIVKEALNYTGKEHTRVIGNRRIIGDPEDIIDRAIGKAQTYRYKGFSASPGQKEITKITRDKGKKYLPKLLEYRGAKKGIGKMLGQHKGVNITDEMILGSTGRTGYFPEFKRYDQMYRRAAKAHNTGLPQNRQLIIHPDFIKKIPTFSKSQRVFKHIGRYPLRYSIGGGAVAGLGILGALIKNKKKKIDKE